MSCLLGSFQNRLELLSRSKAVYSPSAARDRLGAPEMHQEPRHRCPRSHSSSAQENWRHVGKICRHEFNSCTSFLGLLCRATTHRAAQTTQVDHLSSGGWMSETKVPVGLVLPGDREGHLSQASPSSWDLLAISGISWLADASPDLSLSSHCVSLCVSVSKLPLFISPQSY